MRTEMALNLPPVIQVQAPAPAPAPAPQAQKQLILCITRDLTAEQLQLFQQLVVVKYDDDVHKNLPITSFQFDVLILDLREKGDRYCYTVQVAPNKALYNVVCYCYKFEMHEDVIADADNALATLPVKQATAQAFLNLLLVKRIQKPRWYISLFRCILSGYKEIK